MGVLMWMLLPFYLLTKASVRSENEDVVVPAETREGFRILVSDGRFEDCCW